MSLASLAACGGEAVSRGADGSATAPVTTGPVHPQGAGRTSFRGDGSQVPSFGGWSSTPLPAEAVARAGFDWFETGYPGDAQANAILAGAGVRPFAYVSLGELTDALGGEARYTGALLRTSEAGGDVHLVDVTEPSWQDWLVRRADEAFRAGSRGIKWDAATPDVPPGKTRAAVNDAIASAMRRIRDQHSDLKFIFNQGFDFASAYPEFVDAMQTEGLFSARSFPAAYLRPWEDPFYWGPQYQQMKALHDRGVVVLVAEYADPFSDAARELYDAITAQGFVPYITDERWSIRGWGYDVKPGW